MNSYTVYNKYNETINTISQALHLSETAIRDAVVRSYVPDNDETNNRLRRLFCKAARGEDITIAAIGGSITEGAHAKTWNDTGNNAPQFNSSLDGEKCYFERIGDWFCAQFPNTKVNTINAGIGATPSFLGTFRLDQMVINHHPDLVLIEFSVNDISADDFLLKNEIFESYESIIRRLLEIGIAVIIVVTMNQFGNSFQSYHLELADHYNIPAISYQNAIFPDGELICNWEYISPDDVHPNNVGHAFIGMCVTNYLENVINNTDLLSEYPLDELHTSWIYFDTFYKVKAQYANEFHNRAKGFEFVEEIPNISYKWHGALVSENCEGTVKLVVPKGTKRVYVQYFHSNGTFDTTFIGHKSCCNTNAIGWPRAMWHRVYTGNATLEDSEITIKSRKNGSVIILGLLLAF